MQRFLFLIFSFMLLSGCTRTRYIYTDNHGTDSSHVANVRIIERIDTLMQRDSIYITERTTGDTVRITEFRWRDRWRNSISHDTIRDTVRLMKTDTIRIREEAKPAKAQRNVTANAIAFVVFLALLGYILVKIAK